MHHSQMLVCAVVWLTILMGGNLSSLRAGGVKDTGQVLIVCIQAENRETHPSTLLRNPLTQCALEKDAVESDGYMC